ncbi:MAG: eukaryotic-like serine/threonine-protein kinase, partial [Acidimicrobiaceae bacterium]|nr:eukaryotic-like serine/threonine-protein kinase [Acidimicrobiaceae bacterium]
MDTPVAEDTVLGGRYRLGPLLGAGGMAEVYDGRDERLDRPVAVKLLRPDLAAHAPLRQRFELEARAAARLTHPNVVAVYDAGEDQGHSYIVMERLRGESLADVIGRGPVDLAWLRRLAGEVLSALAAAHQAGIIHRDIKPANILLGPDGRGKVADFGIARVAEAQVETEPAAALTGTGLVLGTPAYLAPERAMGEPATAQSDLYSVGVVLYEAVTGSKPYGGRTPVAIAAAAVSGAAENPIRLRPDADAQLVAVIAKAMAVDPAQRYATAAEMAADLRREAPPATAIMPASPGPGAAGATVPLGPGAAGATVPLPPPPPRAPGRL